MKTDIKLKSQRFKIESPSHSLKVQEMLFSLGYGWGANKSKRLEHTSQPCLYANADGHMLYSDDDGGTFRYFETQTQYKYIDTTWMNPEAYKLPTIIVKGKKYLEAEVIMALMNLQEVP